MSILQLLFIFVFIIAVIIILFIVYVIMAPEMRLKKKDKEFKKRSCRSHLSSSPTYQYQSSTLENIGQSDANTKSGLFIVFDTETTGLPSDYSAPASQVNRWPRLVQLSWIIIYSRSGNVIKRENHIIKPEDYKIPKNATAIHGITTEYATEKGEDLETVLKAFTKDYNNADAAVGHNVNFDFKVVSAELYRKKLPKLKTIKKYCTKKLGTSVCCIPKEWGNGFKWPTLQELYRFLFNQPFNGGHEAGADAEAARRCFVELMKRGDVPD